MKQTIQELLTTGSGTEGSLLIVKQIYDTLLEAVNGVRIGRAYAAIVVGPSGIPGSSLDFNLEDERAGAVFKIPEGAPIPIHTVTYTSFNIKPAKYGTRPLITREMIEDSKFDLLAQHIRRAGVTLGETEDSLIITALDQAANTVSGGAAITIANITRAIQYLEDNDYTGTTFLVGPEVANDLRNIDTFVEANKLGSREAFTAGLVGQIFGMDVIRGSTRYITTTSSYVFDKNYAFIVVEKRPVTMEDYDDAINDMSGVVITQRIAVRQFRTNAIAKITTS